MAGVFLILFICCLFFPCQGLITSPPDGSNQTVLPGSTVTIIWSFDDRLSDVAFRGWRFTSSDGSFNSKPLAGITGDKEPEIEDSGLSGVSIIKPATLLLKNVNQSYDGTYQFRVSGLKSDVSDVVVYIAMTPKISVNCSSVTTVNQSDYFACECEGTDGNPPADVTWYQDSTQIVTGKEKVILRFTNVDKDDSGTYRCEAKSGIEQAKNETEIELIVNYPPENVLLMLTRSGQSATITCTAEAHPEPSFKIFFNETELVKSDKTHTIFEVKSTDVGLYLCVAENILGNASSDPEYLSTGPPSTPTTTTTPPLPNSSSTAGPGTKDDGEGEDDGLSGGAIAGIVIGVLVLLVIIIVVVYYCKSKERNGYKGNTNVKPGDNGSEVAAENTYDTASGPSGSRTKPSKGDAPVVYSAVDKENRQGRPLYATLDEAAMRAPNNRKTPEEERPEPTQYASIEFGKTEEVPKADLV